MNEFSDRKSISCIHGRQKISVAQDYFYALRSMPDVFHNSRDWLPDSDYSHSCPDCCRLVDSLNDDLDGCGSGRPHDSDHLHAADDRDVDMNRSQ